MYKKIVIGNWKMNPKGVREAENLFKSIIKNVSEYKNVDVVICAPHIYLPNLSKIKLGKIMLGAQNAFYEQVGAYTGEVSAQMLAEFKVKYCLVGHSERRALGETNEMCSKKIVALLKVGIIPILCVGESNRDHSHEYLNLVKQQIKECLVNLSKNSLSKIIIAYEPVWALSTTLNRRDFVPAEFLEIKIFIKKILSDIFGSRTVLPRIIYGGSARPDNALSFMKDGEADGLLPGRDSLDAKKFLSIIKIAQNK